MQQCSSQSKKGGKRVYHAWSVLNKWLLLDLTPSFSPPFLAEVPWLQREHMASNYLSQTSQLNGVSEMDSSTQSKLVNKEDCGFTFQGGEGEVSHTCWSGCIGHIVSLHFRATRRSQLSSVIWMQNESTKVAFLWGMKIIFRS